MRVLGIDPRIEGGRAVVTGVLVEGEAGNLVGSKFFEHVADPRDDAAQQLRSLTDHFATELQYQDLAAIVVRAMDWSRFQKESTSRPRYQIEGALLAESRRHVEKVASLSGREIGLACGSNKATVEEEARALTGAALMRAGAAALAAVAIASG